MDLVNFNAINSSLVFSLLVIVEFKKNYFLWFYFIIIISLIWF